MLQVEMKRTMKPIQKVLRATQFNQFNSHIKGSSIAHLLKSNTGELCED